MGRALAAGVALWAALASGCGIDLTDTLEGRPCAEGDKCLPGYACVEKRCVLVKDSGARAGNGGASDDASGLGPGGAGSGGASSGGVPPGGTGSGTGGVADGGRDASSPPDSSTHASDAAFDAAIEAGAGGSPGTGGAAGTGGTVAIGDVICRHLLCTGGDACCVSNWSGFPNVPSPGDFSCAAGTSGCLFALRCDGDHDCDSDEVCCVRSNNGVVVASCVSSCNGGSDIRVECTAPDNCDSGEVCCGDFSLASGLTGVRCASSCSSPDIRFCRATADCPSGQNCGESATLPGFRRCGQ